MVLAINGGCFRSRQHTISQQRGVLQKRFFIEHCADSSFSDNEARSTNRAIGARSRSREHGISPLASFCWGKTVQILLGHTLRFRKDSASSRTFAGFRTSQYITTPSTTSTFLSTAYIIIQPAQPATPSLASRSYFHRPHRCISYDYRQPSPYWATHLLACIMLSDIPVRPDLRPIPTCIFHPPPHEPPSQKPNEWSIPQL
jgi:hypothetical protein